MAEAHVPPVDEQQQPFGIEDPAGTGLDEAPPQVRRCRGPLLGPKLQLGRGRLDGQPCAHLPQLPAGSLVAVLGVAELGKEVASLPAASLEASMGRRQLVHQRLGAGSLGVGLDPGPTRPRLGLRRLRPRRVRGGGGGADLAFEGPARPPFLRQLLVGAPEPFLRLRVLAGQGVDDARQRAGGLVFLGGPCRHLLGLVRPAGGEQQTDRQGRISLGLLDHLDDLLGRGPVEGAGLGLVILEQAVEGRIGELLVAAESGEDRLPLGAGDLGMPAAGHRDQPGRDIGAEHGLQTVDRGVEQGLDQPVRNLKAVAGQGGRTRGRRRGLQRGPVPSLLPADVLAHDSRSLNAHVAAHPPRPASASASRP